MAEWSKALVPKTSMGLRKFIVGSNPTTLATAGVPIVGAEIERQRKPCKKWQMKQ